MKFLFYNEAIFAYATGAPNALGGAERQQWLLARAIVSRGHEVVVYSCSEQQFEECVVDGVIFRWILPYTQVLTFQKILSREKPDWWYWRCSDFYLGILVVLAHFHGTRVAFACAFDTDCKPSKALSRRPYMWPLYAFGLLAATRILIQHDGQLQLLPKILRKKARWVPSIVGVRPESEKRQDYIAWVGVLRETKRPHLLVDIANKLPKYRFVVCGPKSYHRTRSEYANTIVDKLSACKNIDYRGQVSAYEAERVISQATILLSTSNAEGFPNTFLQAWASTVPVASIGIDPGGIIAKFSVGIVAKEIDELKEIIPRLIQDKALNKQLGLNGYRYAKKVHNEEFVLDRLFAALSIRNNKLE